MQIGTRIESKGTPTMLGVPNSPLSFGPSMVQPSPQKGLFSRKKPTVSEVGTGRRLLLDGEGAFSFTFWCGTCPLIFERLRGANRTLSSDQLQGVLNAGLSSIEPAVLESASQLIPVGNYLPLLLSVHPRLVSPSGPGDYFNEEQVVHRGLDSFWGLPESPKTPYYRGSSWRIGEHESLFEFVVPMVPPSWNDKDRVAHYEKEFRRGSSATVLALSLLDVTQPFDSHDEHAGLMHFILDGHHKLEAAARTGKPVSILSLLSIDNSLALPEDLDRLMATVESQPEQLR